MASREGCRKQVKASQDRAACSAAPGRASLVLLLGVALTRSLIYAAVLPPWQGPDETGHFEQSRLVAELGRVPTISDLSPALDEQLVASLYEWRYGDFTYSGLPDPMPSRIEYLGTDVLALSSRTVGERFSAAYLWTALFLWPLRGQDLILQLYAARLSSVTLQLGIVWLAWCIFHQLSPGKGRLVTAMTALVVLIPQHSFVNATVGDGTLAEALTCVALLGWVRAFRRGLGYRNAVLVILGSAGAMVSKATAAFLFPLGIALGCWLVLRKPGGSRRRRIVLGLAACCVVVAVAVWLAAGTSLGARVGAEMHRWLAEPAIQWVDPRGITLAQGLLNSHDSFWAQFGWMTVRVSDEWYVCLLLVTVGGVVGWARGRWKKRSCPSWPGGVMWLSFLLAAGVFAWVALLFPSSGYYQYQGRYLFPVVVPYCYLIVSGWARLLPARWSRSAVMGVVVLAATVDAWSLAMHVLPYYYGE